MRICLRNITTALKPYRLVMSNPASGTPGIDSETGWECQYEVIVITAANENCTRRTHKKKKKKE